MAFVLFIVGGFAGVVAMLTSIIAFDVNVLTAFGVWFATGMAVSVVGIALAMVPRGEMVRGEMVEA